jgi:hypothetical protein
MLLSERGMLTYEDSKKMCRVCKPCSRPVSQGVMQTQALPDARACALLDVRERYEPPGGSSQPFLDVMYRQSG